MRIRSLLFVLPAVAALVLTGCAITPQAPISLSSTPLVGQRVGVAMAPLPKIEVQLQGANCLLCVIGATAANSGLARHADTLTSGELPVLKQQLAASLRKRGADVVVIAEAIDLTALLGFNSSGTNVAKSNYAPLKRKYGVDKLLIVEIDAIGFERTYNAYIPTSDPRAVLRGRGYMVNLSTNAYEWYTPLYATRDAEGEWNEPAKFPGLTKAYYRAIELGKDHLLNSLAN